MGIRSFMCWGVAVAGACWATESFAQSAVPNSFPSSLRQESPANAARIRGLTTSPPSENPTGSNRGSTGNPRHDLKGEGSTPAAVQSSGSAVGNPEGNVARLIMSPAGVSPSPRRDLLTAPKQRTANPRNANVANQRFGGIQRASFNVQVDSGANPRMPDFGSDPPRLMLDPPIGPDVQNSSFQDVNPPLFLEGVESNQAASADEAGILFAERSERAIRLPGEQRVDGESVDGRETDAFDVEAASATSVMQYQEPPNQESERMVPPPAAAPQDLERPPVLTARLVDPQGGFTQQQAVDSVLGSPPPKPDFVMGNGSRGNPGNGNPSQSQQYLPFPPEHLRSMNQVNTGPANPVNGGLGAGVRANSSAVPPPAPRSTQVADEGVYHSVVGQQSATYHGNPRHSNCQCAACGDGSQFLCSNLFYVTVFGGNASGRDFNFDSTMSGPAGGFQLKDGISVGGTLGIYHGRNLRAEYELAYRTNAVDRFSYSQSPAMAPQNRTVDGDLNVFTGMSNAYWDFVDFPIPWFTPYVGGGVGFAHFDADFNNFGRPVLAGDYDSDSNFAYQWMVGGNRALSRDIDIFFEYRYVNSGNVDLRYDLNSLNISPFQSENGRFDYISKNILFGLRIRF